MERNPLLSTKRSLAVDIELVSRLQRSAAKLTLIDPVERKFERLAGARYRISLAELTQRAVEIGLAQIAADNGIELD
jgi:hypothetical protein